MIRVLANDGINPAGKKVFADAGIEVVTDKIPQEDLPTGLKSFEVILVRSATQVRKDLIDSCPNLKVIGRAGVGMDNIDVDYAREKGIHVVNTPAASSQSVAELVFAHMFGMARHLYDSNRQMPSCDSKEKFSTLKKKYSKGIELRGKTIGIIGFGKIGQATARMALGLGMKVLPFKKHAADVEIDLDFIKTDNNASINITMNCVPLETLLKSSDFISMHVPFPKGAIPMIGAEQFALMKDGIGLINTARGGVILESDLLDALNSGKVAFAALDVFENEPLIKKELREHPNVSLSPHIGGSTVEAQERIGIELASKVVQLFKS
jgi:D-3-phosphoglycerate dehydrogenase / 2-oxoglutarate reductase